MRLWNATTGVWKQILKGHRRSVNTVAFSPDGKVLVSASGDHSATLECHYRGLETDTRAHSGSVNTVAFSPDGKILASASWDNTVRLWDATTGVWKQILEGHSDGVNSVAFSPDGKILASASWDNTVPLPGPGNRHSRATGIASKL